MARFWPRTIRAQLISGLLIFEIALVALFALFVVHDRDAELEIRATRRLDYQASTFAMLVRDALSRHSNETIRSVIDPMMRAQSIRAVQVTDEKGTTIVSNLPEFDGKVHLTALEKSKLPVSDTLVFPVGKGEFEAVSPVFTDDGKRAYVWIYPNNASQRSEMLSLLRITVAFAVVGAAACIALAILLSRSITQPLYSLLQATRRLMRDPEDTSKLPIREAASSEVADLTTAFNLMVVSIEAQRSGLNDMLALLDSMLANAPIGLAFFDSKGRFVRMNQFLADLNDMSISRHIGRPIGDIFHGAAGETVLRGIQKVFESGSPVRDLEVSSAVTGKHDLTRSWLINVYPVKTVTQTVRWAGAIFVDTTERKRSEEALRRTEKLAAVGQLSASIAHEINNPLEAVTNLLYLLRTHEGLDPAAQHFADQAEHEIARVSEIVQQTLRFHKQSTLPTIANIPDLFESVLALHRGRVHGSQIEVIRKYRPNVELFCFAGEMRQLSNNLIGNALDAMLMTSGKLTLSIRKSRSWTDPGVDGVRIVVADTGCGMDVETQRRIFEPFFTTKEATGTGLGLWVTAEIIAKHNGTVRVRSRPAGRGQPSGTVFMIFFPHRRVEDGVQPRASIVRERADTVLTYSTAS